MLNKPYVTALFPTLLHTLDMEGFNKEVLLDYVTKEQNKDPKGRSKSNSGGWQSHDTYNQFDNPVRQILQKNLNIIFATELFHPELALSILGTWINVNTRGDDNISHIHSGSHLAGVFWISVPENSGDLQLHSPHSFTCWEEYGWYRDEFKKELNSFTSYNVFPKEGRLVIFPSSLYHRVFPNESEDPRVSVSFNIQLGSNPAFWSGNDSK